MLRYRAELSQVTRGVRIEFDAPDAAHVASTRPGDFALQLFERHAIRFAGKASAREVIILKVLKVPQDRLASVKALAAAGLFGERIQAFLDLGWQA
jgi:hypothetical protein